MSARIQKTLITALAAAVGLAAIALSPAAFAATPSGQATDARAAAAALLQARRDADPARSRRFDSGLEETAPMEAHPFGADRDKDAYILTAGTDDAQLLPQQRAEGATPQTVKQRVERRIKRHKPRRAKRRARRRY